MGRGQPAIELEQLRTGGARVLAKAATMIEDRSPGFRELLRDLAPAVGRSRVVGITGSPGAGKSTLVNALVGHLRRQQLRVAVLAVDPTSPFSGGAILGDRVRMSAHALDEGVFIRSMATRGALGGLAPASFDLCRLLDAAGFDVVLLETVGVGQDEVDVARIADVVVVVLAPGMGDDVQAIKAGILEIADVFALNKSDLPGAERLEAEMQAMLDLSGRKTPLVRLTSTREEGVARLWTAVEAARARQAAAEKWKWRLGAMYREALERRLPRARLEEAARLVAAGQADPYTVIEEWLADLPPIPKHQET